MTTQQDIEAIREALEHGKDCERQLDEFHGLGTDSGAGYSENICHAEKALANIEANIAYKWTISDVINADAHVKDIVTHEEAEQAVSRMINSHFNNVGEHMRASIPVNLRRDDDVRMLAYIKQQRVKTSYPAPSMTDDELRQLDEDCQIVRKYIIGEYETNMMISGVMPKVQATQSFDRILAALKKVNGGVK